MADEDVFGHVQIGEDHRLLVDGGNAVGLRVYGVAHANGLAIEQDSARIWLIDAGHNLDECRLARTIFAQQRVDLARVKGKRNIIERLRTIKALGDVLHFQNGRLHKERVCAFLLPQGDATVVII